MHHKSPPDEITRVGERSLGRRGVGEDDVRVATPGHLERLPAPHRYNLDGIARCTLEDGEQGIEQAGVAGGGRGGEENLVGLSDGRTDGREYECAEESCGCDEAPRRNPSGRLETRVKVH